MADETEKWPVITDPQPLLAALRPIDLTHTYKYILTPPVTCSHKLLVLNRITT